MTIQNIQDVMLRIMSLNRNLTIQSLQTLLSASGWDKEDVEEGLRIFSAQGVPAPLIQNTQINPIIPMHQDVVEDTNVFTPPLGAGGTDTLGAGGAEVEEVLVSPVVVKKEEVIETVPVNHHRGLIIILISVFLLIILVGLFLYLKNEKESLGSESFSQTQTSDSEIVPPTPRGGANTDAVTPPLGAGGTESEISETDNTEATSSLTTIATTTVKVSLPNPTPNPSQPASPQLQRGEWEGKNATPELKKLKEEILEAQKEIADLKLAIKKLSAFKSAGTVKYISQKGPAGKTGKGILSVEATSTGFLINYTDKTKAVIPFSTTTILNIINAQALCLNSSTSTQSLNTNCLDQESLYRLLIK